MAEYKAYSKLLPQGTDDVITYAENDDTPRNYGGTVIPDEDDSGILTFASWTNVGKVFAARLRVLVGRIS